MPTFLAQHAVAEDQLRPYCLVLQQLAQGPTGVHRQTLPGQVQSALRGLVQLPQDRLLRLGPALFAQVAVKPPELLHVPECR